MSPTVMNSEALTRAQERLALSMRRMHETGEAMFVRKASSARAFVSLLDECVELADEVKSAADEVAAEIASLTGVRR